MPDSAQCPFSGATRHRRRDLCLFKLTSGSTGVPKALPFTHAQMLADGRVHVLESGKVAIDAPRG